MIIWLIRTINLQPSKQERDELKAYATSGKSPGHTSEIIASDSQIKK